MDANRATAPAHRPHYQVLHLGAPGRDRLETLTSELGRQLDDLGVPLAENVMLLGRDDHVDCRCPVVGLWWASTDPVAEDERALLARILSEGCTVFPVVDELDHYTRLVPADLHGHNGFPWSRGPARLAGDVLRAFGLTRDQRTAFISYKRSDSRAVAVQLFHELSDHGYRVFLDTASVGYGVLFQDVLWDRLSDVDFLLFLDTPGALSSRWVEEELTRAHNHGLGVLQVVWPESTPFLGTDLCTRFLLTGADFEASDPPYDPASRGAANPAGELRDDALEAIADAAERVRMRSLGSRRSRIVGEIVNGASRRGLRAVVGPGGPVALRDSGGGSARGGKALPLIGLPTAESVFGATSTLHPGGKTVCLVYDGLGMSVERGRFLVWLGQQVPDYRCFTVAELEEWLDGL